MENKETVEKLIAFLKPAIEKYANNFDEEIKGYPEISKLEDIDLDGFVYEEKYPITKNTEILREYFKNHKEKLKKDHYYWIIQKWGGIGSFKKNETNDNRIPGFLGKLEKGKLSKDLFGVISSLSKIASFYDCDKYFVYDSRAIYTINWLILKNGGNHFFPMPESRSSIITKIDLDTIIYLKLKENKTVEKYDSAYFTYCDLINELSKRLLKDKSAYFMEILIFTIAEKIAKEVESTVKISI